MVHALAGGAARRLRHRPVQSLGVSVLSHWGQLNFDLHHELDRGIANPQRPVSAFGRRNICDVRQTIRHPNFRRGHFANYVWSVAVALPPESVYSNLKTTQQR